MDDWIRCASFLVLLRIIFILVDGDCTSDLSSVMTSMVPYLINRHVVHKLQVDGALSAWCKNPGVFCHGPQNVKASICSLQLIHRQECQKSRNGVSPLTKLDVNWQFF